MMFNDGHTTEQVEEKKTEDTNNEVNIVAADPKKVAWNTSGGRFWEPSNVAKKLPAGVYSVGVSQRIGPYIDLMKVVTDDLIHLPGMGADVVLDEIRKFWDAKARYKKFGAVHKRGIIMEGPPGSGKTSNAELLVQMFVTDLDGVVIVTPSVEQISIGLDLIRKREPLRPIMVLIEDIDGVIKGGESHLLNLLDGKHQHDGIVTVATTNYIDRLPDRIANRPSRFDLVVKIDLPNYDARKAYLTARGEGLTEYTIEQLAQATDNYSVAHLKELLILVTIFNMDQERALNRIKAIIEKKLLPDQAAFTTTKVDPKFGIHDA
jgi:hypothetical protein